MGYLEARINGFCTVNEMKRKTTPVFVTLGPSGTNHEMVTRNYLAFRRLEAAELLLVDDFRDGLQAMADGHADFMVQAAVHPDCTGIVASAHFEYGIHVVDTFISPSKELGILTRTDVEVPKSLALQPATRNYANLSRWEDHIDVSSIMRVAEGLLEGRYDSGLTTLELADQHPDRLRVDVRIGTVDDPWIVFGRQRISGGGLVAWPDSPVVRQFTIPSGA